MSTEVESPSLMDVLQWENVAMVFIANSRLIGLEMNDALQCVRLLTKQARLSLERPQPESKQLNAAITHDPYCQAAYAYGQRQGYQDGVDAVMNDGRYL